METLKPNAIDQIDMASLYILPLVLQHTCEWIPIVGEHGGKKTK